MRTRLRACARGKNYLPKDACTIPVPSRARMLVETSTESSDDEDESFAQPPAKKTCNMTESWQENTDTILERDKIILDTGKMSDCVFSVGPQEQEFKCHRVYLGKSSQVFEAMLYGDLFKMGEVIKVPEVSPDAFAAMLQYIYTQTLVDGSCELMCQLLYLANKYLLPRKFKQDLRAHIWTNMAPEDMWKCLSFAMDYQEDKLYESAQKVISQDLEAALNLESFLELSTQTLTTVMQKEWIHSGDERKLFDACLKWADKELERRELQDAPASIQEVLEPIIPHFRFLAMKADEFIKGPAKSRAIPDNDKFLILSHFVCPNENPLPHYVCTKQKAKPCDDKNFFVYATNVDDVCNGFVQEKLLQLAQQENTYDKYSSIEFTKEELHVNGLISVQVPAQTDRVNDLITDVSYMETVSVFVLNKTKQCMIHHYEVRKEQEYNSNNTVILPQRVNLTNVEPTDLIKVKVIFRNTGHYAKTKAFNMNTVKNNAASYKLNLVHKTNNFIQIVGYK